MKSPKFTFGDLVRGGYSNDDKVFRVRAMAELPIRGFAYADSWNGCFFDEEVLVLIETSEESMDNDQKKTVPNRGRPDEIKLPIGLRMFETDRKKIEGKYNKSVQAFFDQAIARELEVIDSAPAETAPEDSQDLREA